MSFPKLHIASSRSIGEKCIAYAREKHDLVGIDECDVFISVMYDKLIPEDYIKKHRCYNFHPGLLPEYRGAGAYSWAIINDERFTGVTLHEIEKDIDNGPIIDRQEFPIHSHDTAETLFHTAEVLMFQMFRYWLERLLEGDVPKCEQDEDKSRLYYRKDLEKAKDLSRYKRAFTFEGKESAYITDTEGNKLYL